MQCSLGLGTIKWILWQFHRHNLRKTFPLGFRLFFLPYFHPFQSTSMVQWLVRESRVKIFDVNKLLKVAINEFNVCGSSKIVPFPWILSHTSKRRTNGAFSTASAFSNKPLEFLPGLNIKFNSRRVHQNPGYSIICVRRGMF